ncbi:MAG: phosphotransferase, partial [Cellulosilyticaceae bacterium]
MLAYDKIFKNNIELLIKEEWMLPSRFSREGLAFYEDEDGFFRTRAYCDAGIKMMFRMSGDRITFDYAIKGYARKSVYFDVYENGCYVESLVEPDLSKGGNICYTKKGAGEVVIEIYLPHNCNTYIARLEVEGLVYVEETRQTLLCLGDSITQGMDAKMPSRTYPVQLERGLGMQLVNQGIGGYIFDADALLDVVKIKPDCITVAYGTNDFKKIEALSMIQQRVEAFMKRLSDVKGYAKVYILTPLWRLDHCVTPEQKDKFFKVGQLICEAAAPYDFTVIDGLKLMPHEACLFADGLHPHEAGFDVLSQNLLERVSSELASEAKVHKMFEEIPGYKTWRRISKVDKGWSDDTKYLIETEDGKKLLLRISAGNTNVQKQAEYEIVKKYATLGFEMSQPLDFGICNEGQNVYILLTWVEGEDLETALPKLSEAKQYALGREAGEILRRIHSLEVPKEQRPVGTKIPKKKKRIADYMASQVRICDDEVALQFIHDNIHKIWTKEPVYQHGDFHPGNLILTPEGRLGVIDFNRWEIGDPYEEFYKLDSFGIGVSVPYCRGQIDAYFEGVVP